MMAPDPLDNNRNWVRAAMGLKYLKEGLESFVENEIINLLTTFLQDIRTTHGLPPTATCNQCTFKQNLSAKCPNKLCDKIVVKIVDQHRFTQRNPNGLAKNYNAPCWKNTDATKWGSSPWEIAKCFMANGYSDKISAKETDCTGILSVLINCLSLQNTLTTHINPRNDILSKMRETRNKIMHSSNLEVTDVELQQYIADMVDILDDSKTIQAHPDAVAARNKLNQLKATFVISSRDELKLRKEAVETIEQKQKELLEQCQKQQTDLQSKLDQALASFTQAEGASKQQQSVLQSKVDQATNSISQNQAVCLQNQTDLQSKYDQAMTFLAQAKEDIQSSQGQINILKIQIKDVCEVLNKCKLDIDQVRSDLQKVTDKHEEQISILENRLLLQARLREKYTYQSTIPLSPIMKNVKVDIKKVYQNLVIRPDLIHDPNVNKQADLYFNTINGYREIFFNEDELCKNIFVVGNGGVGKTTWCLKLLSSWVNCKTNDEDNDKNFLQRFKYIFYVPLRHTKQASQIKDMIKSYIFPDEHDLMKTVNDVLLNESERCLVILDGLDEWKLPSEQRINNMGLPHDPLHSKYTTLITSRPWKLEILRLEPTAIDKAVEIKGLDEDGIRQLAGHIIDQLNCDQNRHTKTLKMFIECIRNRNMPMIEVPLMLSIFVYLWYENDFIGETFAGLYGNLTVNLFETAEGNARRIRQNLEVSKLENIKDVIEKRKERTSEITLPIPDCLKELGKLYIPILYSLGKLSFDGLLSKHSETFLVFTQNSIKDYMSEEELEVALYIGILSQSQTVGDRTGERFSISFVHKTIQEFFAAVYMVLGTVHGETVNIKCKFLNYCEKIRNVFEIENVLILICGMDPELAGDLTRQISIMHKDETNTDEPYIYRLGEPTKTNYNCIMLHETLMRCVREEQLYKNESNHVYIVNHFIQTDTSLFVRETQNQVKTETLSYITLNHKRVPMCLYIDFSRKYENKTNKLLEYTRDPEENKKAKPEYGDAICRGLSGIHPLEKLVIYKLGYMSLYNEKGCFRISECINHLHFQTLELEAITYNLGHIDLSNNTELKDLRLTSINIEELSLPHVGCLQNIELKYLKHPDGDQGRLTLNMNNQLSLTHLMLEDITGNFGHINLSNKIQLANLTMTSLQIEDLSLPQNGCLQNVELKSLKHPQGDRVRLTLNINNQQHLKHLTLEDITGNVGRIILSKSSKLMSLYMTYIQIEELSLPQNGSLENVELKGMKHPCGAQESIKLNVNNQPHLQLLTLDDITGNVGHIKLSNNIELQYLRLTSVQVKELSLPRRGCLNRIYLKGLRHSHGTQESVKLNMNNQPYLCKLTLEDNIGIIDGHLNFFNNSKLEYLGLTSIEIIELSLPRNGCLKEVNLKSIEHTQGADGSLTLNMNNLPYLELLTLKDIIGNIGHINLSNNSNLTHLTMTSLQIEELLLPQNGSLKRVELKYIKHIHGDQGRLRLNMNNRPFLNDLILEDITGNVGHINLSNNSQLSVLTLTSLQIEEISLPQDGCLEKVKLKSIKHSHTDQVRLNLNMNNHLFLKYLTLEDITGNVGHINLSNNTELTHLRMTSIKLKELTLPQDGCLDNIVFKSIKHSEEADGSLAINMNNQQHLKQLTLEDITGNFGHINLSNSSELTDLNMTSLQLELITLPHDGCLQSVLLKSIKQANGRRLALNYTYQSRLINLVLEDIQCNMGHIDTSKNSYLTNVSVKSVPLVSIKIPQGLAIKRRDLKQIKHQLGTDADNSLQLLYTTIKKVPTSKD